MARHAILGNGRLTVGLDKSGLVHDFYYPYVGLDNLTTARSPQHKIGLWVDGEFSWVDDGSWDISVDFRDDALIAHVSYTNHELGIHIQTKDFVAPYDDVFCRNIVVTSLSPGERDTRVFLHQVFQISRNGRADTAIYEPDGHYIFDYKGATCILASGQTEDGAGFDQYAIGNYGIEGKEGTFRDAEDGELSGSPVEHGGVDSVLRFQKVLKQSEALRLNYWLAAGETQQSVADIHAKIHHQDFDKLLQETENSWSEWLGISAQPLAKLSPSQKSIAQKSLMLIKAHTDERGGVIASCDSSIYNYGRDYYSYVWPRDAALALLPLVRLGYTDEVQKFLEFCKRIITPGGYLMHKYQPDGAVGSTWHPLVQNHHRELPIQEDETAVVVLLIKTYLDAVENDSSVVNDFYDSLVKPAADFMTDFVDEKTNLPHASYDLWEEKFLTTTYTTATVIAALKAAAAIAKDHGNDQDSERWLQAAKQILSGFAVFFDNDTKQLRKGFLLHDDGSLGFDNTLDTSSMYGIYRFLPKVIPDDVLQQMLTAINSNLTDKSPSGGVPRYQFDQYFASDPPYSGNPWIISTLWTAQFCNTFGDAQQAQKLLDWVIDAQLPSGVLPEQVDATSKQPKSVTPLVWSHAELVSTLLALQK